MEQKIELLKQWFTYMRKPGYFNDILINNKTNMTFLSLKIFAYTVLVVLIIKYLFKRRGNIHYLYTALWSGYTSIVCYLTVIGRNYRDNTLHMIYEGWGTQTQKELFEAITNVVMLFPFALLLLLAVGRVIFKKTTFFKAFFFALFASFLFSAGIEWSQVHWGRGTFQISDLVYNTIGGTCAGFLYGLGVTYRRFIDHFYFKRL